ncbi:hypothetical protein [Aquimarina sp. AU119]|uniref:hypothetical protein n=1 Tax=Aquimarina sp. AU119 TaxID=2108528 RepID=UPI000D686FC2|nr:hypothetical protein [Aquimarina sp. AU119]
MIRIPGIIKKWMVLSITMIFIISCADMNSPLKENTPKWKSLGNSITLYSKYNNSPFREMNISLNANTIAIADQFKEIDSTVGPKKIATFKLRDTIWSPFGNKNKDTSYFTYGQNYKMNGNANRIVIANLDNYVLKVRTFDLKNKTWALVNNDSSLVKKPQNEDLYTAALSGDCNTLGVFQALNANNKVKLQLYSWTNHGWIKKGNKINVKKKTIYSGFNSLFWDSVNINKDGSIITVANPHDYDNGPSAGKVKVFKFLNNDWQQVGNDIDGEFPYHNLGISAHIGNDGKSITIFSHSRKQEYNYSFYTLENNTWIKQDNFIPDTFFNNYHLGLSKDGKTLLTSKVNFRDTYNDLYTLYIYRKTHKGWKIVGYIDKIKDKFNEFVLSEDGTKLAILFDGYTSDKHIKVYGIP